MLYESAHAAGTNPSSDPEVQGALNHIWPVFLPYIMSEWADIVPVFLGYLTSAVHALPSSCSLTKTYDALSVRPPAACLVRPSPAVVPASSSLAPVVVATSAPSSLAPSPIMHSGSLGLSLLQLVPPSLHAPSLGPGPSPLTIVGPEFFSESASLPPMHIIVCSVGPCPTVILPDDDLSDSAPVCPAKHIKSSLHNAAHPVRFNKSELIPKVDLPASYTSCCRCQDMKKRYVPLHTAKLPFGDCGCYVCAGESCVWLEKAKEKAKPVPWAACTSFLSCFSSRVSNCVCRYILPLAVSESFSICCHDLLQPFFGV